MATTNSINSSRSVLIVLLCLAFAAEVPMSALSIIIFADSRFGATILIDTVLILLVTLLSHVAFLHRALSLSVTLRNKRLNITLARILCKVPKPATIFWAPPIGFGVCIVFVKKVKPHYALVAVSIAMAVLDFVSHHLFERLNTPHKADSESCTSWSSETTLGKTEAILAPNEKERWLQRRNSLSSQRAIYPYTPPACLTRPHGYRPSTASSRTFRSTSFEWSSDRSSSSFTSSSISTASASRRYRSPANFPSIPELPRSVENLPYEPVPPPPPAWCPPLRHAPLSADPVIRSLTATRLEGHHAPPSYPPPPLPAPTLAVPTPALPTPALPKRAPGHSGNLSTSHSRSHSHTKTNTNTNTNTSIRTLRRPPSIRYPYPNRQRLWTYTPAASGTAVRGRPSMYSMSSYGTISVAYTRL